MAKKRKKSAIPKRIGGVKIPKPLRRSVRQFVNTQSGKAIAAEVLAAVGAAFAASHAKRGSPVRQGLVEGRDHLADLDLGGAAASSASAVRYALGEATRTFREALQQGKAEADAREAWPEAKEQPPAKKPSGGPAANQAPH